MFAIWGFDSSAPGAVLFWLLRSLFAARSLSSEQAFRIESKAWFIWMLWWLAMAFFSKSTKRRESVAQRIEHLLPAALGFLFLFRPGFGGSALTLGVFPDHSILQLVGVTATIGGLLFAVWARLILGSNWSGSVTIKQNHQLIRRGPYRWIRHPIYTGMLTALAGTAISQGMISGLLGLSFVYVAFYRKARREESFLSQEFGDAFAEHRQHTGMFFPRFS